MIIDMVSKRHIRNYAKCIGRRFHPQRVILFGSYASGMATEDSDVDLLVIMDHDKSRNIEQAIEIQLAADAAFPMDLIVRRPEEVNKRLAMNDTFLTGLLNDGEVLYG
jgi:predicted nucleotidyltransferase